MVVRPQIFSGRIFIEVARDIPPNEPLLFYLPFARSALVEDVAPPPGGVQIGAVTGTTVHLPDTASLSAALNSLVKARVISIEPGRERLVDVFHEDVSR